MSDDKIKLKNKDDLLSVKKFFDDMQNKIRVAKLIKLVERLPEPDFDLTLDEMKFTKLKKYKDYPLLKITKPELKQLLGNYDLKEETYIKFLGINKFDKDTYSLQLDIFIDKFIRINLKEITLDENLNIIFAMYDKDKDGIISKKEAHDLLTYFSETSLLGFDKETMDIIITAIYNEIDSSKKGEIDQEDLRRFLLKFQDKDLTINPFIKVKATNSVTKIHGGKSMITQFEEKEMERIARKTYRSKFSKAWHLNKKMIIWTILYILVNLGLGFTNSLVANPDPETIYIKVARVNAGMIFFNITLAILFMCLTPLTYISSTCCKWYLPLGDTILYHQVCGCMVGCCAVLHVAFHIPEYTEHAVNYFFGKDSCESVNFTDDRQKYLTISGLVTTGLFMFVIILPIIPYIKNKKFEVWWYFHKFFLLATIAMAVHANIPNGDKPYKITTLVYLTLPMFLWIMEVVFRIVRYVKNKTKVTKLKYLQSGVLILEIEKPANFTYICGQYASVNIPKIAFFQWHPFTFASSPDDDKLYFFIAPAGDWTNELKKLCTDDKGSKGDKSKEKEKEKGKRKENSIEINSIY